MKKKQIKKKKNRPNNAQLSTTWEIKAESFDTRRCNPKIAQKVLKNKTTSFIY
jgi:hypothetical protein